MDKQLQNECLKVLRFLYKIQDAEPFKHPVDFKLLQLYDYPDIVKNPMDLGTIETNLKQKKYKSSKEFFDDLQLVWNNCKQYNQDGSSIHQQAVNMEKAMNSIKQTFSINNTNNIIYNNNNTNPNNPTKIVNTNNNNNNNAGIICTINNSNNANNIIMNTNKQLTQHSSLQASSSIPLNSSAKPKKQNTSQLLKKKIKKNKEGSSSITVNTNTNINSALGSNNAVQPLTNAVSIYQKKDRNPPINKNETQTDKYTNQSERKYAHISLRLNLAFKLRNATDDKFVNLFAMLAEKHPETLANIDNREQKLQMNLTLFPDQIIQNMIAALEFKD